MGYLDGKPAIAWALSHPTYLSPTGRTMKERHIRIMVIHDLVIVGKGILDTTRMRFYVSRFQSPDHAQSFALDVTTNYERKGYDLVAEPVSLPIDKKGVSERLTAMVHKKAAPDAGLYSSFVLIFRKGKKLSPILVPHTGSIPS